VTPGTVSRALSGKSGVSEDKRAEIIRIASEMNYTPNFQASSLRSGRRAGLMIATPLYGYNSIGLFRIQSLYQKASRMFGQAGIAMKNPCVPMCDFLREVLSGNCEFLVINGLVGELDWRCAGMLRNSPVKTIIMDGFHEEFDSVEIFRENGTFQAARLFLLGGRSKIFFLINSGFDAPNDRLRGIMAAHESVGLSKSDIRLWDWAGAPEPDHFRVGFEAAEELLTSHPADAIFCSNDEVAIGALAAARKMGLRVPEDVAITGVDNIPESKYTAPPLTTVGQPVDDMTDEVIRLCMSHRDGERKIRNIVFKTNLVARESAPLPASTPRDEIFRELEVSRFKSNDFTINSKA